MAARLMKQVERAAVQAAAALLVLMTVGITADVASRLFAKQSIAGIVELSITALVFIAYAGLADGERTSSHVAMTFVSERLSRRASDALFRVAMVPVIAVLAWTTAATASRARESFELGEFSFGLVRIPVWPGRLVVAAAFALVTVEAVRTLRRGLPRSEAAESAPSV